MTVAFRNLFSAIEVARFGSDNKLARLSTEPHGSALGLHTFLFFQQANDGVGGVLIEFGRVGALESADVAREFDDGDLHAETQTQIWNLVFAGVLRGLNLAF